MEKTIETAKEAARRLSQQAIKNGFQPEALHEYRDSQGNILHWRIRLKNPVTGDKWIRPMRYDDSKGFLLEEPDYANGKPLYNLDRLISDVKSPVIIVEGEICVDRLTRLGALSTTSGGAGSVEKTDLQPLAGRLIIIWRDNDKPGKRFSETFVKKLRLLGCEIRQIDVEALNLPEKADVLDWLTVNPNTTIDDILNLPLILPISNDVLDERNDPIRKIVDLDSIEYERQRKFIAKELGIRVSVLDKYRKSSFNNMTSDENIFSDDLEPWPNDINLAKLLDELCSLIDSIMVFASKHEVIAISLYIIHTHCLDAAFCAPILNITSPEMQCGKTTLLSIINHLVYRPLSASNTSSAAAFRSIEKWTPTLIIDEGDTFLKTNEELRGIINSGHTRSSAFILRCVGDNHEPKRFSTWCSKVVAGIGRVASTIHDRSITIRLRRKQPQEHKVRFRDIDNKTFEDIKRQIIKFSIDRINDLSETQPQSPATLSSRAADNWEPLLAIASIAGEDWLTKAKQAAIQLTSSRHDPLSTGIELLADIKKIFDKNDLIKIYSVELIDELCKIEESMWGVYNKGKPIHPRQLADLLKEYNIYSKDIRISPLMHVKKGYESEDFEQAFNLYLSTRLKIDADNATPRHEPPFCSVVADNNVIPEGMV